MNKSPVYINKILQKRQQQRILYFHRQNLTNLTRPSNKLYQPSSFQPITIINNKKKQMRLQDKFTEIQRQNRMLLEKINTIMNKKPSFKQKVNKKPSKSHKSPSQAYKMNSSLNHGFRKKQLQDIEIQNAKLLKRLQQKKSDYQVDKMNQQWKKQKNVIKNLVNYPFIIRDKLPKRRKSMTSHSNNYNTHNNTFYNMSNNNMNNTAYNNNSLKSPINLIKIKNINNIPFIVTIKYQQNCLTIIGENKCNKEEKVIQIPKQQALQFIHFQCNNKIQNLFNHLQYDINKKVLYLVGNGVDIIDGNDDNNENNVEQNQQEECDDYNNNIKNNNDKNNYFISDKKMSKICQEEQFNTQKQSQIIYKNKNKNHNIFTSNNLNHNNINLHNHNTIGLQQKHIKNQQSQQYQQSQQQRQQQQQKHTTLLHNLNPSQLLQLQLQKSIQQANHQHHLQTFHNQQNYDNDKLIVDQLDGKQQQQQQQQKQQQKQQKQQQQKQQQKQQ